MELLNCMNYLIRDLQKSDIPTLIEWLNQFNSGFDYPGKANINTESATLFFSRFIDSASQFALMAEDNKEKPIATLGFSCIPHPWTGKSVLYKAFWYSAKPGAGIELLRYVQRLAKKGAIEQVIVSSMTPNVNRLLEREGYKPVETNYILET